MLEQGNGNREQPLGWSDILRAVRCHRTLGIVVTAVVLVAAVLWALLSPDVYTAEVSLLPRSQSSLPSVFGAFPGVRDALEGSDNNFEKFYGEIATSDRVLDPLLGLAWPWRGGEPATLAVIFSVADDDDRVSNDRVKQRLRRSVVDLDRDDIDGFMRLKCSLPEDPDLAAALANAIADGLDGFNLATSQQRARQQREFIGTRLQELQVEMEAAEDAITGFVSSHRGYAESPELTQRHRELRREADAVTTMWVELKRQYELSRVEEQRNLNSLTILDRAVVPVQPSGPNRPFITGLGLFFGLILGAAAILLRHFVWSTAREATGSSHDRA